jgi:hypothetical protein
MASENDVTVIVTLFKDQPDEQEIKLHLPVDWNFEEAMAAKEMAGGMLPDEVSMGMMQGDPAAWLAILRVSYLHDGREFPSKRIMGENVAELTKQLSEAMREAAKGAPFTGRPTANTSVGSSASEGAEPHTQSSE